VSDPSDPLSSLFQAGRAEVPSAAAKAKAAAALGIGAGTTAVAAGAGAATVLKVGIAIAVVSGGAFVGGMQLGEQRSDEKYQAQLAELQKKYDEKPVTVVVQQPPAPPEPLPAQPVPEPVPEPKPVAKPAPPAPKEEDTLTLELAALDRVRTRMKDDDYEGALKELAAYEKKFPKGAMTAEASLMRIEALLKAGRRDEAEALGQRVLEGPAPELMKQRVRRLLSEK